MIMLGVAVSLKKLDTVHISRSNSEPNNFDTWFWVTNILSFVAALLIFVDANKGLGIVLMTLPVLRVFGFIKYKPLLLWQKSLLIIILVTFISIVIIRGQIRFKYFTAVENQQTVP